MTSFTAVDVPSSIGVAMNNSTSSMAALIWASQNSETHRAPLVVASVTSDPTRQVADEVVERIVNRCPSTDYRLTVVDAPSADLARAIAHALGGCDLIAVGAPDSDEHRMLAFELARLTGASLVEVDANGTAAPLRTDGMLLGR